MLCTWTCFETEVKGKYEITNSIKKYKCTLQVGPLFLQMHTKLNKFPSEASNLYLQWFYWIQSVISLNFTCALCSCKKLHL